MLSFSSLTSSSVARSGAEYADFLEVPSSTALVACIAVFVFAGAVASVAVFLAVTRSIAVFACIVVHGLPPDLVLS
jgi:hypothetical protein